MTDRSRWIPLVAVVLVIFLGATCFVGIVQGGTFFQQNTNVTEGQPDDNSQNNTNTETDDQNSENSGLPFSPTAPGEQVLTLPGGDPPTLDPHLSGDATSAVYIVELYSGLVTYNSELELIPDLAKSWETSDDNLVYTFHLRENAQFHNGKSVRAQDFKWSFERACDFQTGSTTSDTYLGDIVGCRDKLRGRAEEVTGVQIIDDLTLEVTIDAPKAYFLAKLSYPTAFVLDQENVERGGRTWTEKPNGTGPFKLDTFIFGQSIVFTRNEDYYRDPAPQLDRINFSLTGGSAMIRYENDEYDIIPVGINDIDRVTDPNNPLNVDLLISDEISIFYVGFNVNQPPFDDPLVRQAFNYALNKEKIVSVVYKETVPVADGIIPNNMPGYSNPDLVPLSYDPDKARELITQSSYGDVSEFPEITLYTTGSGGSPARITEAIVASYLEELGVDITIEQTDWSTFLVDLARDNSPYQMFEVGWIADYPDPQNFVDIKFHSQSRQNNTHYNNLELDAILDKAALEQDPKQRLQLYRQAEQIIVDDAPWVPLYLSQEYWLVKPHVKGFDNPPLIIPKYQYVFIGERG